MLLSSVCCGVVGVSLGGMYMFVMVNVLLLVAWILICCVSMKFWLGLACEVIGVSVKVMLFLT